jgi:hypothetical protein
MMNDVKHRDLIEAFSQHEEKCIEEFCEFAKVIPPAEISHLKLIKRVLN